MTQLENVSLKDGSQVVNVVVTGTMMHLQTLQHEYPVVFYELVMKARDPEYQLFGNSQQTLADRGLIESNGSMHTDIRTIIRNAVVGEGFAMALRSPYPETE